MQPLVVHVRDVAHRYAAAVQLAGHLAVGVVHEQFAAGHAAADLVLDRPEDQHAATGHVLAGILACGFRNDGGPAVADAQAVPRPPADEHRATRGPEAHVVPRHAEDFLAVVRLLVVQRHAHSAATDALGHAVLGHAAEFQIQPRDAPRPEALARFTVEQDLDAAFAGHSLAAVQLGDVPTQCGPHAAIRVADLEQHARIRRGFDCVLRGFQNPVVQRAHTGEEVAHAELVELQLRKPTVQVVQCHGGLDEPAHIHTGYPW